MGISDWLICIMLYIDELVQERHDSIANALELHLSCTNPLICFIILHSSIQLYTSKTVFVKQPQGYHINTSMLHRQFKEIPLWLSESHKSILSPEWDFLYWYCLTGRWNPIVEIWQISTAGPWFSIKMPSHQYKKSHCGDKMVMRSSYLHNGSSYIG